MADERLQKLYELIEDIEIAMFTTRRADGRLVSRPMATQKRSDGADLWFATSRESEKLDEIRFDPHVNLGYLKSNTMEWVSVSGKARIVDDRAKVRELWAPDWRAWFGDEGGGKDGTADDPRILLIGVNVEIAVFLEVNKPKPVVLFELMKGMITGKPPKAGETVRIEGDEIRP